MSKFYVQTTIPVIKVFHKNDLTNCYQVFSGTNTKNVSGRNLQTYSFQRSIKSFSGSFSMTVKEDSVSDGKMFMDQIQPLDVVKIYEDGDKNDVDFIGVITDFTYNVDAASYNKTISIQGRSISNLFEMLNLNTEITAMIITDSGLNQKLEDINITLANSSSNQSIKAELMSIYELFCTVVKQNVKLSNGGLINLINKLYGSDFFDFEKQLKFYFTIVSNFFERDVVTYPDYIRGLMDQNVYEMYECIENNQPKIKVRECPFDTSDWKKLNYMNVDPSILLNYTISRSINDVYTVFYSVVEGSVEDSEYYIKAGDTKEIADVPEKRELYGYKPLRATFIGYSPKYSFNKQDQDSIKKVFRQLNNRLKNWYGNLDEMYLGTISVAKVKDCEYAKMGEKLKIINGEFYITGEDHQWRYGSVAKIIYHVERGGKYDINGNFSELKGFTKKLAEITNMS